VNDQIGQICADNKLSRKSITEESLEYLNLIAVHISRSLTQSRESRLTTLMNTIPDYIYFKDRESRFLQVSRSMLKYFDITNPKDLEGKTDFAFFDHTYAQQKFNDEKRILTSGKPIENYEEPDCFQKGHKGWVSTTKLPLKTADGTIIGTYGISRDITKQKSDQLALERLNIALLDSQEKLRKAKNRLDINYEEASRIAHFGFWEWDMSAKVKRFRADDEVYRVFGFEPQQLGITFENIRKLVHPDDLPIWNKNFSIAALDKSILPFEIRFRFEDGTIKYIYAKSEIKHTIKGHLKITGFVQDVTERKLLDKRGEEMRLAVRGFQHMIPGKADEALYSLSPHDNKEEISSDLKKAICFIFMIRHKADEVKTLRQQKSWFSCYSLAEIWDNAWPIALDLTRTTRDGLNIYYDNEVDDTLSVNGGFYTAAVNILANSRSYGTEPVCVWVTKRQNQLIAIFSDGGPKPTHEIIREDGQESGVGLSLVKTILEIIGGNVTKLTLNDISNQYLNCPETIKANKTFYKVETPTN